MQSSSGGILIVSYSLFPASLTRVLFLIATILYAIQLLLYWHSFHKEYKKCVLRLEEFYDEEESGRMKWIAQFFYTALAVGILALILALIPFSSLLFSIFIFSYTVYYIYVAGCVLNYRINAGFIIHAKVDEEEKARCEAEVQEQTGILWGEDIRQALDKWVAEKKYIEMDTDPDTVAKELGTTRALMNSWFARYEHITFREWRTRQRIREAARILAEEEEVYLSTLHEEVGVSDKSNFRKHFKQLTGMSPTEYRKSVRRL